MALNYPNSSIQNNGNSFREYREMVDSIVAFVTASSHLASTLRNTHSCISSAQEVTGLDQKQDEVTFYIEDFQSFLKELETEQHAPSMTCKSYQTFDAVPLIQFPAYDVTHGEPNNEPRLLTLTDIGDFGDVKHDFLNTHQEQNQSQNNLISDIPKLNSTFKKSESSIEKCFFEVFTDSDLTIASLNLQDNFDCTTKESRKDEPQNLSTSLKENNKITEIEQVCTIYDNCDSNNLDLVLECDVEDVIILPKSNHKTNTENKDKEISTHGFLIKGKDPLNMKLVEDSYSINSSFKNDEVKDILCIIKSNEIFNIDTLVDLPHLSHMIQGAIDTNTKNNRHNKKSLITKDKMHATKDKGVKNIKINKTDSKDILNKITESQTPENCLTMQREKGKPAFSKKKGLTQTGPKKQLQKQVQSVDYITKNIVECLNKGNKNGKQASKEASKINQVPKSPLKFCGEKTKYTRERLVSNLTTSVKTKIVNNKILSSSDDNVRPICKLQKTQNKKPSAPTRTFPQKTVLNQIRPLRMEPLDIATSSDIKSCLKSVNKIQTKPQKKCVICDEKISTFPTQPSTTLTKDFKIIPKIPLVCDTTLKLSATQTLRKVTEILKSAEEKVLKPASAVKDQTVKTKR